MNIKALHSMDVARVSVRRVHASVSLSVSLCVSPFFHLLYLRSE